MLPLEVAEVVNEFAVPGGVTLERRGPGSFNGAGELVPAGSSAPVLDPCAVVPATGRRLNRERPADETRETIEVYARAAMYAGTATQSADVVLWAGRRFTVVAVESYEIQGGVWVATAELQEAAP